MSRASPATLELAEHFTTIRLAGEGVRTQGATPLTVGTLFATTLIATDLHQASVDDGDLRRHASYREFRRYANDPLLPCLEDQLLASLALHKTAVDLPAIRSVAPADLARCLLAVGRLIDQPYGSLRIGIELIDRVESLSRDIRTDPAPAQAIDLPVLIGNHRRIDEMSEALDLLGDATKALAVRQHSRILARAVLGRITSMMEVCLIDRAQRGQLASSIAAPDLLAIVRRVVDGVRDEYDPATRHYGDNLGLAVLRQFAAAMLAIEHQTLSTCRTAVDEAALPVEEFSAALRLLVQLRAFGRALPDGTGPSQAVGAERAAEQALQLLRAREIVQGVDTMARDVALILAVRARDGSDRQHRLDAYAALFEAGGLVG